MTRAVRNRIPRGRRRTVGIAVMAAVAVVAGTLASLTPAGANHPEASLAGSNFEIDVNANLKVDDAAPSIDWASVADTRATDAPSGQNDNSYSGGAKEDDACPGTTTGSIPNNKSDLLTFGAYVEPEVGGPGFLNLFWTRVQEPSGTTLMDFELNQSSTPCGNGVNPVRTVGDLLIEYRIEQGGAVATLKVREWTGTAWGAAVDLTALVPQQAAGTINATPIPVGRVGWPHHDEPAQPAHVRRGPARPGLHLRRGRVRVVRQRVPEEPRLGRLQLPAEGLHRAGAGRTSPTAAR